MAGPNTRILSSPAVIVLYDIDLIAMATRIVCITGTHRRATTFYGCCTPHKVPERQHIYHSPFHLLRFQESLQPSDTKTRGLEDKDSALIKEARKTNMRGWMNRRIRQGVAKFTAEQGNHLIIVYNWRKTDGCKER